MIYVLDAHYIHSTTDEVLMHDIATKLLRDGANIYEPENNRVVPKHSWPLHPKSVKAFDLMYLFLIMVNFEA
jgi:hypothetical protein